ncbi:GAF domain-containing protein, partial [Streptomyces sp. NPDC046931]|uniref:GAF domain-containing sensor histidine kinase n=1 Tax=Streptomyces sp. NPDC046931 TaxID=3154806 RepID=UPI0033CEC571
GAAEFDAEDEAVLSTLAVAAGVAVENARLYEKTRLRERWLKVSSQVTNALLSGAPGEDVLELMVEQAQHIVSADVGMIAERVSGEDVLRPPLAVGLGAERRRGLVACGQDGFVKAVLSAAAPVVSADIQKDVRINRDSGLWAGLGPVIGVPLGAGGKSLGVLLLGRTAGRTPFTDTDAGPLLGFAGQAALALELAERRREAEHIALLQDHERIARDLHDLAIQRLFAAGMTLQSTQRFVDHPEAAERLSRTVDDLDETIKIIRSTIFGLRIPGGAAKEGAGLRRRVSETVMASAASLGFTPALRIEGLVDTDVPDDVADQVIAVLGEALSNTARHAWARSADVCLRCELGEVTLMVTDDGCGIPEGAVRSGLKNMEERALALGGTLTVGGHRGGGGTRLVWRVPVRAGQGHG